MILSFKETPKNSHADKLTQLKVSQLDALFLADLQEINDDFDGVDKVEIIEILTMEDKK